jgi:chromatin remodeling complex protein RSC6
MATKKAPAPKTAEPAASKAVEAPAKKRAPNAAFMKPLTPSAELAAIVGKKALPRTEIISKMWVYIKEHNLQDPDNKRMINADDKLAKVFGKPQVSMFEMAGLIGKHVK